MKYFKKTLKIIAYIFFSSLALLLILLVFVAPYFLDFKMSQKEMEEKFVGQKFKPVSHYYESGGRKMHYVEIGKESLPLVIFVHGSPGSWSAWVDFFKDSTLLEKVRMIAVDRPGFGDSDEGNTEVSLAKQAALLKPVLEKYSQNHPIILVGHSLGGPLIARMAMDYPELIDGLIYVAPSIDPEMEEVLWYQTLADFPIIKYLIPSAIRVSNQEILPLKGELDKMMPLWKNIKQPSIFIHGTKDQLVPIGNADFAKKMLDKEKVRYVIIEGMDHFVPWTNPELIRNAILELLEKQDGQTLR